MEMSEGQHGDLSLSEVCVCVCVCVCVKGVKDSDWFHGITDLSPSSSHTPFYFL